MFIFLAQLEHQSNLYLHEAMENSCKFVRPRNCGRIDSCTKVEIRLILVYFSSTLVLLGDPEGFSIELINLARICA